MKTTQPRRTQKIAISVAQTAWLERVRSVAPAKRIAMIERRLRALPKTPTTANVFFRKTLLRLMDESRLKAGLVNSKDLQKRTLRLRSSILKLPESIFVVAPVAEVNIAYRGCL